MRGSLCCISTQLQHPCNASGPDTDKGMHPTQRQQRQALQQLMHQLLHDLQHVLLPDVLCRLHDLQEAILYWLNSTYIFS